MSWGITSRTVSPAWARSPVMELAQKSSGMHWTSACRSWGMFSPVWALTGRTGSPPSWMESSASTAETSSGVSYWSHWFSTARTGNFFS